MISEYAHAVIAVVHTAFSAGRDVTPNYFAKVVAMLPNAHREQAVCELRERANTWLLRDPQDAGAWQLLSLCLHPAVLNVAEKHRTPTMLHHLMFASVRV
jgi:hypothetical protein